MNIEERARLYLDKVPGAVSGSGGHDQTFTAACALVKGFNLSVDEARHLMRSYNSRCEPPWTENQLEHKLTSADRAPDAQPRGWLLGDQTENASPRPTKSAPVAAEPKTEFQPDKLIDFAGEWRERATLPWLADRSSDDPSLFTPDDFLSQLYGDTEKVVIFTNQRTQGQAVWPLDPVPLSGPEGVHFLAQPVDGEKHPNPRTSRFSRRSEESVTSWRYLVVESDQAPMRDWIGALVQLPLRIAAIYTSGGRSIHALVRVDAGSKAEWDHERDQLKEPLIVLGADPKSLSAVRLTRLPGCLRAGKLQKLLYFKPSPNPVPICELPAVRDTLKYWLNCHLALLGVIDTVHDERTPAGFLNALEYYSRSNEQCEEAAAFWRSKSPPAPSPIS